MSDETLTIGQTFVAVIHMAGDIDTAKKFLRRECYREGLCVTVSPETFIYTGGEEEGFSVRLVDYPRFPSTPEAIRQRAYKIAQELVVECSQRTALVVDSERTAWISTRPPGAR